MIWQFGDIRDMQFENQSFELSLIKPQWIQCFTARWDPPDDVRSNIDRYLSEVERILVPGGTFLYITYRQPHFLRPLLARDAWDIKVETLPDRPGGGVFEYFAYIMRKHGVIPEQEGQKRVEGASLSSSGSEVSFGSSDDDYRA